MKIVGGFLVVTAAVIVSYHFLDATVALHVDKLLRKARLASYAADVPDLLFPMVCVITVGVWAAYFHLVRKGIFNLHTRFFQIAALSVPLSYVLKLLLKYAFGRASTRLWLHNHNLYGFRWFHGGGGFDGFPSGHMAVFTALVAALWRSYPAYRHAYLASLSILAAAMVVTGYHFVSDVIAGAYLGLLIVFCVDRVVTFRNGAKKNMKKGA